jgi:hypothetical protein
LTFSQSGFHSVDITALEGEQRAILEEYVNAYKEILDHEDKEPRQLLLNVEGTAGCISSAPSAKNSAEWQLNMVN